MIFRSIVSSVRGDPLLDLRDLGPPVGELPLDSGADPKRFLSGLDLGLAPDGVGRAARLLG